MDSTPSNGSRTRKANTRTRSMGEPPDGQPLMTTLRDKVQHMLARSTPAVPGARTAPLIDTYPAIAIEAVQPAVDGGQWPIKRVVGDTVQVSADILKEGHDVLQARVIYRALDESFWHEEPMLLVENDRWTGAFR